MINNDVLRSVRYMLDINDAKIVEITGLAGHVIDKAEVIAYLKKEAIVVEAVAEEESAEEGIEEGAEKVIEKTAPEEGYLPCPDEVLAYFLDGLVIFKRGKNDNLPAHPIDLPVTNNMVLKKLRVAFELKEDDLHAILKAAEFPVSKPELSALFRKFGHSNYRTCGDQLLRNFLKGLTLRIRG
jgi:uncharacterized protein YehS (DUF1456 family)